MKNFILLITIFFCALKSGFAQSGEPDSAFGNNGTVTTNFESLPGLTQYRSIAIQADGKLVAAGFTVNNTNNSLALARYDNDGSPDKSFSGDGKVSADSFTCTAMAIQKNGKIVVAGSALARYNTNGYIDSTFSGDGQVVEELFTISAMALQDDGKIIVAGNTGDFKNYVIKRYNTDGDLDNSFSGDGKIQTGNVKSILVQNDGKIIAAGFYYYSDRGGVESYITLNRYTVNGNLDNSFDGDGKVTYSYGEDWKGVSSAALQDDGKIMVSGAIGFQAALIRFNNDGSVDGGFGSQERVVSPLSPILTTPVIVKNDGKIIIASTIYNGSDFAIARYNADGSLDSSFSDDGIQTRTISDGVDIVTGLAIYNNTLYAAGSGDYYGNGSGVIMAYTQMGEPDNSFGSQGVVKTNFGSNQGSTTYVNTAVQTDGKIVVVGSTNNGTTTDFAIARYTTNGSLDIAFNGDGKQTTSFGSNQSASANSVAIQTDGKIVVIGTTGGSNLYDDFAIARYNIDGSPDTTFNKNGRQTANFGDQYIETNDVAIQSDGKIVVVGTTGSGTIFKHIALVRYNADGSADSVFDGDGKQTTDVSGKYSYGSSVVIQSDQKIVVSGSSSLDGVVSHFTLVRYNNDGSLDNSFNSNGIQSSQLGNSSGGSSLALQADGKLVMAGNTKPGIGAAASFTIARYNSNGSVDSSFDKDGRKLAFKSYFFGNAVSVAIQANGKILAGGYVIENNVSYPAIASFNADGSFNTDFSSDGMLIINNSTPNFYSLGAIAIAKNKFYTVGSTGAHFGIVSRYVLDDENQTSPAITLTTPVNNSSYLSGSNVYVSAAASDADGTISKVEFYSGATLLHTATDTPYTFKWLKVNTGNYTLTARATDNNGLITTSDPVHISVVPNKAPTVSIIKPANGEIILKGGTIHLQASAQDADGRITKVEFYNGATLLATELKLPYTYNLAKAPLGAYVFTAKATDNWGAVTTSAAINVSVALNNAPSVNILSPANGENFVAPATINLEAAAADPDGRIVKVDFYNGAILLNTVPERKPPYSYQWQNVPAGVYTITAVAQDNWGETTTSAPITVTVTANGILSSRPSGLINTTNLMGAISLHLAPNPAKSVVNIYTTGLQNDKQTILSIISATGVTVKTIKLSGADQTIPLDVSSLAGGVYTIKIISGEKVMYRKFVKL